MLSSLSEDLSSVLSSPMSSICLIRPVTPGPMDLMLSLCGMCVLGGFALIHRWHTLNAGTNEDK